MRLPIDTTTVKFAAAGPAEPVLDFETRQPKTDENGVPLFDVPVFAAGSGVKDSIKMAAEVKGLSEFTINLVAGTWEVESNLWPSCQVCRFQISSAQSKLEAASRTRSVIRFGISQREHEVQILLRLQHPH